MKTLVALVATKYRGPEAVALLASLPQGEPLVLKREPTNAVDQNAVQVWARDVHIGYIKSQQNKPIAIAMDAQTYRQVPGRFTLPAKLALDGGKWPMVEITEGETDG